MLISLKLVAARLNFVAALLNLCFVALGVFLGLWIFQKLDAHSLYCRVNLASFMVALSFILQSKNIFPTTALEMLSRGKENGQIMLLVAVKYNFTLGIGAVARSRKQNNTNGSSFQAYSKPKFPKGTKIILCISQTCSK